MISIVSLIPMTLLSADVSVEKAPTKEANSTFTKIEPVETPNHALINTKIKEIKPPRTGVKSRDVLKTKSPFLMFETGKGGKKTRYAANKKVKLPPLKVESAINKNVKINGKWYKEGDRVRHYTIIKVSTQNILLKSKTKELKLYLKQKNDKINFNVN